jgi:endonuclease YncB( thermonuclease family)
VREQIVGKKAEFRVDYNYGGRDYGTLMVDGVNINTAIVRAGLAKVVEKKGSMATSS